MRRLSRPLTALLLGLLVASWGPCPGTVARLFADFEADAPTVSACGCGCGCGSEDAPGPETPVRVPGDKDCPYCSVSGGKPDALLAKVAAELEPLVEARLGQVAAAPRILAPDASVASRPAWATGHGPPPDPANGILALLL